MWAPDSWQQKSALQQPEYADPAELERVLAHLHALPPLVTSWEILRQAKSLQYTRIKLLRGGLAAWKAKGYTVERYMDSFRLDSA